MWTEYRGDSRKFYQGLIQAAVALHHFGNGNIRGAKKLYSAAAIPGAVSPAHGDGSGKFLAEFDRCFAEVVASQRGVSADRVGGRSGSRDPPRPAGGSGEGALQSAMYYAIAEVSLCRSSTTYRFRPNEFSGRVRLFPLPNLVMFPNVMQPLRVFEPRYIEMVEDALAGDRLIAMGLLEPGWEHEYDGRPPGRAPLACLGKIATHPRL